MKKNCVVEKQIKSDGLPFRYAPGQATAHVERYVYMGARLGVLEHGK